MMELKKVNIGWGSIDNQLSQSIMDNFPFLERIQFKTDIMFTVYGVLNPVVSLNRIYKYEYR